MNKNKENRKNGGTNVKITSVFKVKKCLFTSNSEFQSPKSKIETRHSFDLQLASYKKQCESPDMVVSSDDSPYSLFTMRKRRLEVSSMKFELDSTTPNKMDCSTPLKRSQSFKKISTSLCLQAASPENSVKIAVQKSFQNPDLIGDFSKECVLPIIEGKHPDLKSISSFTVAKLIKERNHQDFTIVDCRYPYEFTGGHIKNARNIYCKGNAEEEFFSTKDMDSKTIYIFYCEFSSERAPGMIRFLRGKDRELNKDRYPFLYYPELYVIEGGYKEFYANFKELCEPQDYKPMLAKEFSSQMSFYRNQCKSWKKKNKRRSIRPRLQGMDC